jgi:hypothetical protein
MGTAAGGEQPHDVRQEEGGGLPERSVGASLRTQGVPLLWPFISFAAFSLSTLASVISL